MRGGHLLEQGALTCTGLPTCPKGTYLRWVGVTYLSGGHRPAWGTYLRGSDSVGLSQPSRRGRNDPGRRGRLRSRGPRHNGLLGRARRGSALLGCSPEAAQEEPPPTNPFLPATAWSGRRLRRFPRAAPQSAQTRMPGLRPRPVTGSCASQWDGGPQASPAHVWQRRGGFRERRFPRRPRKIHARVFIGQPGSQTPARR